MAQPRHKLPLMVTVSALAISLAAGSAFAGPEEARRWIDAEFQPSTLSKDEQMKEMEWFINAAKPIAALMTKTASTSGYQLGLLAAAGSLTLIPGAVVIYFVRNYIAKGFALGRV